MSERKISAEELVDPDFKVALGSGQSHRIVVESNWFEVQILDGRGEPVPGVSLKVSQGQRDLSLPTNAEGVARLRSRETTEVRSALADATAARQLLDPRWEQGIDDKLVNKGFTIQSLQQAIEGVTLEARQRVIIALIPLVVRVRLIGMFFETSKTFLLPKAMNGIRRLKTLYDQHPSARVLVVGHADTAGAEQYNLQLSLERADAMGAFLTDKVDEWLVWYEAGKPFEKRWGTREDQHMLSALPEGQEPYLSGEPTGVADATTKAGIKRFQTDAGLKDDGIAGPITRRALIERYMAIDGTSLPPGCELVTHGCGENFPEEPTADSQASEANRRVEVFIFEGPIVPPPPGKTSPKGSLAYPAWRAQVSQTVDVGVEGGPVVSAAIIIFLHDHLGQRMGANPAAPDPILREQGAPYRLSAPTGEIRTGFADPEGRAVEIDFPWNTLCLVEWGKREESPLQFPPHEEEDAEEYYLYSEHIFLVSEPEAGEFIPRVLQNLGYPGSVDDGRQAFAADYGSPDDQIIHQVHALGQPKRLA